MIERPDMFVTHQYAYYVSGNVLYVDSGDNEDEYTYSKETKDYDPYNNYWYIDGDVLYFDGRTYYKQKD